MSNEQKNDKSYRQMFLKDELELLEMRNTIYETKKCNESVRHK
jgi:hypothetical protein